MSGFETAIRITEALRQEVETQKCEKIGRSPKCDHRETCGTSMKRKESMK